MESRVLLRNEKVFYPAKVYCRFSEVLTDHGLAALGDAYINFVCSLALSKRKGEPTGAKVKGSALSEALRSAGLRAYLPSRMNRHSLADAAEALLVYAWLYDYVTLNDCVNVLEKASDLVDGLNQLLIKIKNEVRLS